MLDDLAREMKNEIKVLKTENNTLRTENENLKANIDELEQYSRRNAKRITGISENENENTDELVKDLAKKLNVDIHDTDKYSSNLLTITLNADLTKRRQALYKAARQFLKEKKVSKVWTWDGKIFLTDINLRKHRIDSHSDLLKFNCETPLYSDSRQNSVSAQGAHGVRG
ncbi:hypothetical protein KUTeg_009592 [Tegillarca granosa]|uniref:FP protein N-terminal domain-containing protein n=1 Tax=Tegillarca granosa TaxID=220873 RepID=A0ABQ9F4C1_TEGGR|nr:hypothetical protein KUTeg_009592 [Tegillarca granosa]